MKPATLDRRSVLIRGGLLGLLASVGSAILPRFALAAWNKAAFDGKNLADTYRSLGVDAATESPAVRIVASDIAENGAVVPIQVVSTLADTTQIAILVEKNPNTLAAVFDVSADMVPDVTTRIKMGQTSNVVVLVKAGGQYFTATKEIKVTLGGCGG